MANKCTHPGYIVKDGKLVCASCGEPSPKAKIIDGELIKVEKEITCPHCGGKLTESGRAVIEEKNETAHEDKAVRKHEDKSKGKR